ncbi:MAG: TolC family protein [Desulfobacterales bacterium]
MSRSSLIRFMCLLVVLSALPGIGSAADMPSPGQRPVVPETGVLTLEEAKRIAVEGNPDLFAAFERLRQAEERVRQARAAYWPTLDASASGARVDLSDSALETQSRAFRAFNADAAIANPEDVYQADLTAGWMLFTGFRRWYENARARFGEMESRSAIDEARRFLLFSVARSYYQAQLAREDIAIARADQAFNLRQAEEARARRRAGTGALSDVLNFEIQVNAARSALNDAQRAYAVARITLASVMGIPDAGLPDSVELTDLPTETPVVMTTPEPEALMDYAERFRPDLLESTFRVKQAEAGIGVAQSEYYPNLTLQATADGYRENSARFARDDFGSSIGLFMNYNLFSGGSTRARVAEARYLKREAERAYDAARIAVFSEVREAVEDVLSSQKELRLQRENEALVQRNRDLVEKGYAAGQESLVRLNEAQRNLTQAQARLALSRVALRLAWERLDAATAGNLAVSAPETSAAP